MLLLFADLTGRILLAIVRVEQYNNARIFECPVAAAAAAALICRFTRAHLRIGLMWL